MWGDTHGELAEDEPTMGPRAEPPAGSWGRAPGQEVRGKARGNHCRVSNTFFKLSCRLVGIFQDDHFEPNIRIYGSEGRVKLQTMTEPPTLLLPSKNSPDLYRSQKWGGIIHPSSHRGDAPARRSDGTAHEAGDSILCCEGSDALFSNDFGEYLLS